MRPSTSALRLTAALLFALILSLLAKAQAPPTVQFFMPDGSLPTRQLRFKMQSEDGRIVDTFFTDTKGRFLITRSEGLRPNAGYTLTIESDGRTFDSTVFTFYHYGDSVYYVPIFLKALTLEAVKPTGFVDLAELDAVVPKDARDAYNQAMRAISERRSKDALSELNRALEIYPEYFRALNDLGVILMKLNRLDEAAQALERASRLAPRVYYPRLNLAVIKTRQKKNKEAIALLERLHKDNPVLVEVRVPLADALMAVGRLNAAEDHLRAAIADLKLDSEAMGDARYKLGLLLNRQEKYEEAVTQLMLAAKALPNSARTHLQLGGALLQMKKLEQAERELTVAYQLGGAAMGGAQFLLGQIYFIDKKYEKAVKAFEQYLADVPQAPNAAEVRGVIEKIKSVLSQK